VAEISLNNPQLRFWHTIAGAVELCACRNSWNSLLQELFSHIVDTLHRSYTFLRYHCVSFPLFWTWGSNNWPAAINQHHAPIADLPIEASPAFLCPSLLWTLLPATTLSATGHSRVLLCFWCCPQWQPFSVILSKEDPCASSPMSTGTSFDLSCAYLSLRTFPFVTCGGRFLLHVYWTDYVLLHRQPQSA
jgi:hypothetical protein